jgi:Pyruvate/2-oxoacid:ferredoxin oxidoreductase delta subunit
MGGIMAYRYRSACQMCTSPRASGAHLNLGVLGLPVRQHLLIQARDSITAEWLRLDQLADREADPDLVEVRERTVSKMAERNNRTRERITQGLADVLPRDVGSLIEQFEACGACQECLNNCPICAVDSPRRGPDRKYLREDITRWMISCAGCGMCEQACPHHLPLTAIFHYIKQQLAQSYGYTPGLSASEPLPLM